MENIRLGVIAITNRNSYIIIEDSRINKCTILHKKEIYNLQITNRGVRINNQEVDISNYYTAEVYNYILSWLKEESNVESILE